jgi:adenylylsulfate kinase-like enzyme
MAPPVLVLTGQLAAGKSTLAVATARAFPRGVHIDLDGIREMVVSGLASPLEWTDETTRQFGLAFDAAAAMAAVYHRAGFVVVIEGGAPPADLDRSLDAAGLLAHRVGVVLHPSLEVALERNRARTHKGFDTSVLDDVIRSIDADLRRESDPDGWHRIDNGAEPVEATVRRILDLAPA